MAVLYDAGAVLCTVCTCQSMSSPGVLVCTTACLSVVASNLVTDTTGLRHNSWSDRSKNAGPGRSVRCELYLVSQEIISTLIGCWHAHLFTLRNAWSKVMARCARLIYGDSCVALSGIPGLSSAVLFPRHEHRLVQHQRRCQREDPLGATCARTALSAIYASPLQSDTLHRSYPPYRRTREKDR